MRYKLIIQALRESSDNNFSQLYRNVDNLWELMSSDFNLPVSERRFYQ